MYDKARQSVSKDEKKKKTASASLSERKKRESEQRFGAEYLEDVHAETISRYLSLLWNTNQKLEDVSLVLSSRNGSEDFFEIEEKRKHAMRELESCIKDVRRSLVLNSSIQFQNEEWRKQFAITMTGYLNNPDKYEFVVDPCQSVRLDLTKWPTQSSGKKKKNDKRPEDPEPETRVDAIPDADKAYGDRTDAGEDESFERR